jgi:hypothetical protein
MRYDRAFPVAVPEPQITRFCVPRRMNAKVPGAAHSGGYGRRAVAWRVMLGLAGVCRCWMRWPALPHL